jgi:hypothetical protein
MNVHGSPASGTLLEMPHWVRLAQIAREVTTHQEGCALVVLV